MVMLSSLLGAAVLYAGFASARPMPDNNIGEVAVSAPNGTPESEVPTATALVASTTASADVSIVTGSSNYGSSGSSNYGSSGSSYSGSSNYGSGSSYGGSSDSSSYGGSSDSSNYGSGSSNYGGSNYGNSGYSSADVMSSTVTAAASSYTSASYGSGSSNWGGSGYDSCVQQCVASFGAPSSVAMATATSGSEGSSGSGATHTVWVAPTQGVLRYVPFATNASVGDTIKFVWGGNDHTVTKSSILGICNKTADAPFVSGEHNLSFVFTQVVNDTNPTFYYCGTPGHCQKGMFGIINPPNAFSGPSSVGSMMPLIASNNSATSASLAYTNMVTANNSGAANWGASMDMSQMPDWSHSLMAENVLYTRAFLASNPEILKDDGTIDMSAVGSNPLMLPNDVAAASNNAASSSSTAGSSAAASSASASSAASTPSATPASNATKNGAGMVTASRVAVALISVFAAALVL